ncbi:TLD-domain-containing protein [Piromyces finnis]|uniref:Oxidation resistance protein 1 n=1 Tax=Piromyces finnis TaxID=1754191 RepID=A0A1Y1V8T0_9FUNG|nr:TLD-domain-containing protein [Piromyces finnis]|eukprot:ORX48669.1 TLD-domain-containing protein [Piromyces finnis]
MPNSGDTISTVSNSNNNYIEEEEIIQIKKPKKNIFKKFFSKFKKSKKEKSKKEKKGKASLEIENETNNYNTVTSTVSFSLPSTLNNSNLCSSSTATVKFTPTQYQPVPSILNRSLFVAPSDDTVSEADTEITLVDPLIAENKKSSMKKKKLLTRKKHKRRHSWQDSSFNEHIEDPRNCRTVTNIKEILEAESKKVELHNYTSSSFELVMNEGLAVEIKKYIPRFYREACNHWYLEYSLGEHGSSLTTFYESQMDLDCPIVMVITDSYDQVFGAYLSEPFNLEKSGFTGNRECFLWKKTDDGLKIYRASSINDYYMMSDQDFIAMGVDENGVFGLFLDNLLLNGECNKCDTYLNEILSSKKRFECTSLEVWSVQYE